MGAPHWGRKTLPLLYLKHWGRNSFWRTMTSVWGNNLLSRPSQQTLYVRLNCMDFFFLSGLKFQSEMQSRENKTIKWLWNFNYFYVLKSFFFYWVNRPVPVDHCHGNPIKPLNKRSYSAFLSASTMLRCCDASGRKRSSSRQHTHIHSNWHWAIKFIMRVCVCAHIRVHKDSLYTQQISDHSAFVVPS